MTRLQQRFLPAPALVILRPAGGRLRAPIALALLLLLALLILLLPSTGTPAQNGGAGTEFAATVAVDATADTVVKAREMARLDGQRRALAAVVARLAGGGVNPAAAGAGAPAAKLAKLGDQAITDLVASFEVANERMSAVRYLADYTFHFRPDAVRRLMADAGIAVGTAAAAGSGQGAGEAAAAGPTVVLPVYQSADGGAVLWDDPNPWRDAWEQRPATAGPVQLIVPLGDAGDIAAVDAAKARAGDAGALAAVARRNGGGNETLVALAAVRGSSPSGGPAGLDVTVRDYRAGLLVASHLAPMTANPGESDADLLRRAAAAVASDVESGWKKQPLADAGQEGSLTAVLPIDSLDDWVRARARLDAVPQIKKLELVALSRQQATVEIDYVGSIDQLKTGLAQISLDLIRGDPLWRLARNGPAAVP